MHMYNQVLVYVYTLPMCVLSVLLRNKDPCSGVGFIMRHTIHTMFYGGSYLDAPRSNKRNFDISGILFLLAFLWCPAFYLSYLSSCFREYSKKLARKIWARFDPQKFTQFNPSKCLRSSTCDVAFLVDNSKNDADANADRTSHF
jgi:hypothetical protein